MSSWVITTNCRLHSYISQILLLYKTWWYYNKFDKTRSLGVCYWLVIITQCGHMEHGLKHITFYVQKHIAALVMCYNAVLVRDKPIGAPAFVKKKLLWLSMISKKCFVDQMTLFKLPREISSRVNSFRPGQNGCHSADDIFRCIFVNEKFCILIKISLKFVPKGPIGNKPALVRVMAWRRPGDKPLSEPMLTQFTDAYMRH